jgi:glucose-fructose oxidoreductase
VEKKLNFALVGLGFGESVIPAYKKAAHAHLKLLCDVDERKAALLSEKHGIPFTVRFEDCLREDLDVVDVSTPNHLHAEQAAAALRGGKHVLLQKPMARDVNECRRILAVAAEARRKVGVFMFSLNQPLMHELRRMVAEGAFGRILLLRGLMAHRGAHLTWKKKGLGDDYWRRCKELTGGGAMALIGIHKIHLLPWLAGSEVEAVSAFSDNLAATDLIEGDDVTSATCKLKNGALAVVQACYSTEGDVVEILGTAGSAVIYNGRLQLKLDLAWSGPLLAHPGRGAELSFADADLRRLGTPLAAACEQHDAFARAVLAEQPLPVSGEQGLRDTAVLQAIYASAASGKKTQPEA